ncbi:DUF3572 family protein [Ahrensia sp. R2A130]|uniref:DUF3572 family protein n=1 Tax=Ahrensia sp. R2A130 TaxID=744979 RepID=UPI0001E0BC21|nr:DUF3572 family protein [Ahrensia sp. R2A130]EFL90180.1 conserved hypothetical protein [Ahrensia sp. R2A130]
MTPLSHTAAEALALAGLARLAADDELLLRFCELTGILSNEMREAATQPNFLPGVLDFYLAHEPDLLDWARGDDFPPEHVMAARYALAPEDMAGMQ